MAAMRSGENRQYAAAGFATLRKVENSLTFFATSNAVAMRYKLLERLPRV